MHALRTLNRLRWWVVAWFVLGLGAAQASLLVQPRAMELICSGGAGATLVVHSGSGSTGPDDLRMDCPLCLAGAAPPQPASCTLPALPAATHAPARPPRAHVVAPTAAPPPARAPPFPVCLT